MYEIAFSTRCKKLLEYAIRLIYSPVIKNFFIYSFGNIILRGISLFLAPITLTILNPSDYGLLALVNSFTSILAIFLGLGLRQVFSIEYFHHDSFSRRGMINDIISIYLFISIPALIMLGSFISLINQYIFLNSASYALIVISLVFCFIYFFAELFYQVLRYQEKAWYLTLLQTSIALLTIGLNLFFLCVLKWGVLSMIASYALGTLIACLIALKAYYQKIGLSNFYPTKSLKKMGYYLKFGFPFIPGVLFGWILASGDRWVLARYATLHDVGIYSLADTFGQLYQLLVLIPMSGSYLPHLFKRFADNKDNLASVEHWNRKNMYISMIGMSGLITGGYLILKPFLHWFLPIKYHESIDYIWFILMGYVFLMGTYFASSLIQFHKKTYFLAFSLFIPAIFNIILNIILIPYMAIYGCVIATLASYIVYFLITIWYNNFLLKTP